MEYLDSKEIKDKKDSLLAQHQAHSSWDIRSGQALRLVRHYVPERSAAILDFASASGAFLLQLSEAGYSDLSGLDIDDYRIPEAKKFHFKKGDVSMEALPWPDGHFKAVVSLQTVEHLDNPYNFAREAARVISRNGILLVSMPNPFHILNRLLFLWRGDLYHYLQDDNHITFFTRSVFKKTFLRDFDLIETAYAKPEFKFGFVSDWRWLRKLLPANQWFGRYIYYVLKRK